MSVVHVVCCLIIHGRVQRVGYRAWTERSARAQGLEGWVRNRGDGTVEAMFKGPRADVDGMIAACRRGPPGARVEAIQERASTPDDLVLRRPGEFIVLPTA